MSLVERLSRWRVRLARVIASPVADETVGWRALTAGSGPVDREWSELRQDYTDILEAWRRNFLIRQIVRLTTGYVVGDGISITSGEAQVAAFVRSFWDDPQNNIEGRLSGWCDELTRAGELYIALFPNRVTGMQYVRVIPAASIAAVETDPDDYEKELGYLEQVPGQLELKRWKSVLTAGPDEPVLLHYAVNRVVGATRGESDLLPILPWARRYAEWLRDRVVFNRLRNQLAGVVVKLEDDSKVEAKRKQYEVNPPIGGAVTVVGKGEEITFPAASLQGDDATPDGHALRLAVAAGANVPLHFLAEGSSATRSTAREMSDPTHRHYRMRQRDFAGFLVDMARRAYVRYGAVSGEVPSAGWRVWSHTPDISRADNEALASSAATIVGALAQMKQHGWVDDETAIRWAFKFAGEVLSEESIQKLLTEGLPRVGSRE